MQDGRLYIAGDRLAVQEVVGGYWPVNGDRMELMLNPFAHVSKYVYIYIYLTHTHAHAIGTYTHTYRSSGGHHVPLYTRECNITVLFVVVGKGKQGGETSKL